MKKIATAWIFLVAMLASANLADARSLEEIVTDLGARPCEDSILLCLTIDVPRDHFANDPSETLPITFAISPAIEESAGIVFYAVGGPGGSGVGLADGYISAFDEQTQAKLDFVFFDQRGVGSELGLDCPTAQAVMDTSGVSIADESSLLAMIETYVAACQTELSRPDILPIVGTDQAIRDLEMFRQAIGAPQVWLYGESYGTQFMQSYATLYPQAAKGVILDGVVDLNLSADGFYRSYVLAAERILARVLETCTQVFECATDMKEPATAVYDNLMARVAAGEVRVDFPTLDGSTDQRTLTPALFETTAFLSLYGPDGRASFLRALAASAQGDKVPMLRLAYSNLYIDPETEEGFSDPTWFGAAYFAINCRDYSDGAGTPDVDAQRILAEARALAPDAPRFLRSYYIERLVCAYWPTASERPRPEPFAGGDYPTLLLNSDADPITPVSMAYSVLDNVKNGYLVVMQGGPHVIWGRGLACPDATVSRLIIDGTPPPAQVQLCQQDFIDPYLPLTLTGDAASLDAFSLGQAIETELDASVDFANWSYHDVLEVSCNHGGRIKAMPTNSGATVQFTACAFWPDLPLYGDGTMTFVGDAEVALELDLSVLGAARGQFVYVSDGAAGTASVSGTLNGKPAKTPRPLP